MRTNQEPETIGNGTRFTKHEPGGSRAYATNPGTKTCSDCGNPEGLCDNNIDSEGFESIMFIAGWRNGRETG